MEPILIGVTDRSILVFFPDPASTTGQGKTGLNAAALTCSYTRVETDNDVVNTDVTSSLNDLASLTAAHADWGVKEVSNTLAPGLYRLDLADALFASGAWYVTVSIMITTGTAAASTKAFQLVAWNPLDGVRLGLTALPNAAADAAGGLPISDAGGLDLDAMNSNVSAIKAKTDNLPSDPADASVIAARFDTVDTNLATVDTVVDAIKAKTDNLPSDPADASVIAARFDTVDTNLATVDTVVDAIKAKTDNLPADPAGTSDIPTALENAETHLKIDMSTITGEASHSPLNAHRSTRNDWSNTAVAGKRTVYKEDGTTVAFQQNYEADPSAEPITGLNS